MKRRAAKREFFYKFEFAKQVGEFVIHSTVLLLSRHWVHRDIKLKLVK